jgi:hypothetical protein
MLASNVLANPGAQLGEAAPRGWDGKEQTMEILAGLPADATHDDDVALGIPLQHRSRL